MKDRAWFITWTFKPHNGSRLTTNEITRTNPVDWFIERRSELRLARTLCQFAILFWKEIDVDDERMAYFNTLSGVGEPDEG